MLTEDFILKFIYLCVCMENSSFIEFHVYRTSQSHSWRPGYALFSKLLFTNSGRFIDHLRPQMFAAWLPTELLKANAKNINIPAAGFLRWQNVHSSARFIISVW